MAVVEQEMRNQGGSWGFGGNGKDKNTIYKL